MPEASAEIGVILGTRQHPIGGGDKKVVTRGGASHAPKYHKAYAVLWMILERAGFTSLGRSLDWGEMWARVHGQLKSVHIHRQSRHTFADFSWMPGRHYTGGLVNMNRRLRLWDHPDVQAEAWAFGIMGETPVAGHVELYALSAGVRAAMAAKGSQVFPPHRFDVSPSCVARVGRTGPFIALAIGSFNAEGDPKFAKPEFHRIILQAITSEASPVPVESQHERDVVLLLQRKRIEFKKPVFSNAEGLRPDFVLPSMKTVIEVQGMKDAGYREHKRVVHERILMSESYAGYRLVKYEPNEGEKIGEFEGRLLAMLRQA